VLKDYKKQCNNNYNSVFYLFIFNSCVLTLKDEKRKQLTFFRKSANRCESQLITSDLDGLLSKLMVPKLATLAYEYQIRDIVKH